jgi:hypothetical protein
MVPYVLDHLKPIALGLSLTVLAGGMAFLFFPSPPESSSAKEGAKRVERPLVKAVGEAGMYRPEVSGGAEETGGQNQLKAKMLKLGLWGAKPALDAGCTYKAVWKANGHTLLIRLFNPDGSPATHPDQSKWFGVSMGDLTNRVMVKVYSDNPKDAWVTQSFFLKQGPQYVFYGKMYERKL